MKFSKKKSLVKILSMTLALFMMVGLSVGALDSADGQVNRIPAGYSTGAQAPVTLGESTYIDTPEDLKALSELVNAGADVSSIKYVLNTDIMMTDIEDWVAIGTTAHPFNGYFDGQGHVIRKLATPTHPSLFGYINGGTLKNITISVSEDSALASPNSGLFISAENATIENCNVFADMMFRGIIFSNIQADISWYENHTVGNFQIADAGDLVGLSQLVQTNGIPGNPLTLPGFEGETIELADGIDMSAVGDSWQGIGTQEAPFKGAVVGGGVTGLKLNLPGKDNVGLFAYTQNASFTDVKVMNSHITAGNSVGLLIGKMENTEVIGCMSSGTVGGTHSVGGLIGDLYDTVSLATVSKVEWCYSTADVKGIAMLGGLIGTVDGSETATISKCFSTGSVSGVLGVGGVIGEYKMSELFDENVLVDQIASMGDVTGIGSVGGIFGAGENYDNYLVSNVYSASNVYSNMDAGGIAGTGIFGENAYTSGYVVAPRVTLNVSDEGESINYGTGIYGGFDPVFAESNALYSADNILNATDYEDAYQRGVIGGLCDDDISYFDENRKTNIGSGAFSFDDLVYEGVGKGIRPVSGHYPQLLDFSNPNSLITEIDEAFKQFSEISTNVIYKKMPEFLSFSDGFASATPGGEPIRLPLISSGWIINGSSGPVIVQDTTRPDGVNTLAISGDKITMADQFLVGEELVITGSIEGLDGFEVKYTVKVKDEAARPNLNKFPKAIYTDKEKAKASSAILFGPKTQSTYIPFDEIMILKDSSGKVTRLEVDVTEHANMDFTGATTKAKAVVTISNNTALKIEWPAGFLKYNRSYSLQVPTDGVADELGNAFNEALFFKTPENLAPKISFNPDFVMAKYEGSSIEDDKQILALLENDPDFFQVTDGITIEDERFISGDKLIIVDHKIIHSAQGKESYPTVVTESTPTQSPNFYLVPGEYEYKYKVPDPDEPADAALMSRVITRTYKIEGATTLKQDGGNLKPIYAVFTSEDVGRIVATMKKEGLSVDKAFEQALEERYIKTKGPEQLKAYGYNSKGTRTDKKITFNTAAIDAGALKSGYEAVISFSVEGGESYNFTISIAGRLPDKEIIPTNLNFIAKNTLSRKDFKYFIDAKVVKRSNPDIRLNDQIYFDFSKVNKNKFDIAQEVTLTLHNPKQEIDPEDVISAKVSVTIVKDIEYVHPEERWVKVDLERIAFWENKLDRMRNVKAGGAVRSNMIFYDGVMAPTDFFLVLKNKENISAELRSENGYKLLFKSSTTDTSQIEPNRRYYNFNLEDLYSLAIERDAKGAVTQQFSTQDICDIPGTVEVTIPITADLPTSGLAIYSIDQDTNRYVLESKIPSNSLNNNEITIVMDSFMGEYVITAANLDGVLSSFERDYLIKK